MVVFGKGFWGIKRPKTAKANLKRKEKSPDSYFFSMGKLGDYEEFSE